MWGHVTQYSNFGSPLISRERLKLETSNLARIRAAVSSNKKNAKLGQKGSCGGHVTQFRNFGTPLISREWLKLETSNFAWIRAAVSSNKENAKLGQGAMLGSLDPLLEFWHFLLTRERLKL